MLKLTVLSDSFGKWCDLRSRTPLWCIGTWEVLTPGLVQVPACTKFGAPSHALLAWNKYRMYKYCIVKTLHLRVSGTEGT